ncbi:MAG: hypothetical protein QOF25_5089 [Mycobacterium sp.]|nr:hypothetical protein [Mycobacterium sp.]
MLTKFVSAGDAKGRGDLVFTSLHGAVLRNSNYPKRHFTPAVEKCQKDDETFPDITPHDLRHTAASLAISAGANVKAVQKMLGHAKASMTFDVYADLFDDDLDAVANRLDAEIIKTSTPSPPATNFLRTGCGLGPKVAAKTASDLGLYARKKR